MRPEAAGAASAQVLELAWGAPTGACDIAAGEVHLWRVDTPAGDSHAVAEAWALLADGERHRALSYRDETVANEFVLARGGLRSILGGYLGCEPAGVRIGTAASGRPFVESHTRPGLGFSVSRGGGVALVALVDGGLVGVDVERVPDAGDGLPWELLRANAPPGLIGEAPDDGCEAFALAWTRLEAFAKAFADGLGGLPGASHTPGRDCHVQSFRIDGDLAGALATDGGAPPTVRAFARRQMAPAT